MNTFSHQDSPPPRISESKGFRTSLRHIAAALLLFTIILAAPRLPAWAQTAGGACSPDGITAGPTAAGTNVQCTGGVWVTVTPSPKSGTICGMRSVACGTGTPIYDTSTETSIACNGTTLTITCSGTGLSTITSISGCPTGYTGKRIATNSNTYGIVTCSAN